MRRGHVVERQVHSANSSRDCAGRPAVPVSSRKNKSRAKLGELIVL